MDGVVQGGWEYVIGAYAVTAAVFAAYVASVVGRVKAGEPSKERR